MGLIEQNNLLTLRPAMKVLAGLDETSAIPWQDSATNTYDSGTYDLNAHIAMNYPQVILMDLGGYGFVPDGRAKPIDDNLIEGGKYGYISEEVADEDGFIPTSMTVTVIAQGQSYEVLTFTLADSRGNQWTEYKDNLTWTENAGRYTTTVSFDTGKPNRTLHVLGVKLGKSWSFDNTTLIKCSLSLRGVETTPNNPELQLSEIEIQAYEPNDYSNVIGHITKGAPIWYTAGYEDDMSETRRFYLNQKVEIKDKVITIRGYDATYQLEGQYIGSYISSDTSNVKYDYENNLIDIILDANIDLQIGDLAEISEDPATTSNIFLDNKSKRNLIANAMNMYRQDGFCINYVDAGIPRFTGLNQNDTVWTIRADQVANFSTEIELATEEIQSVLYTAAAGNTNEDIQTIDAVNGQQYWVNLSEPYYSVTATGGTIWLVSPYTALFTATATGTATIRGKKIFLSSTYENNPYSALSGTVGDIYSLDDQLLLPAYDGNAAQMAIDKLVNRSNVLYSFVYRGNPKMQPRDYIEFEYADGTREMMTIESLTLEHENGGLISQIAARRGII